MSKILIKIFFVLAAFTIYVVNQKLLAQRVEVGATVGFANYVGDLAPTMVVSETKPAIGFFGRYNLSSSFALTGGINFTQVSGSDKNFDFNKPRNLSFRSNITEFSGIVEFNYFKYGLGVLDKTFTSYIFLGLGVFKYNPQAYIQNDWVDLRPIETEGARYGTAAVAIPFGLGIKWRLSKHMALESSFGFRRTYTDHLDDVSTTYVDVANQQATKGTLAATLTDRSAELNNGVPQYKAGYRRGNSDFNDWYVIGGVTLSVRIFDRQKCARFY